MSYQEDLILSIYSRGEPGLAMGKEIPPGKGGSPGQPYDPPKPTGPYVPAPSRNLANLADGTPDASIMNYVTEQGFFLDGQGGAYMQTGGKLYDAGEYNPDIHGLPVPLVQQMKINQDVANITPKHFSPPPFRYINHIRINLHLLCKWYRQSMYLNIIFSSILKLTSTLHVSITTTI